MTVKDLKHLIENLPDETLVMERTEYDYEEIMNWTCSNLSLEVKDGKFHGNLFGENTELCFVLK